MATYRGGVKRRQDWDGTIIASHIHSFNVPNEEVRNLSAQLAERFRDHLIIMHLLYFAWATQRHRQCCIRHTKQFLNVWPNRKATPIAIQHGTADNTHKAHLPGFSGKATRLATV